MLFESRDRVGVDSRTIGVLNTATNGIHEALSDSEVNGVHDTAHIDVDVPVLIIGGGPSGLLQAYLLSRLGVKTLIVERYSQRLAAPKAHALSPRSLEICRQFGLDVNYIRSIGSQRRDAYWVNFVTNLNQEHVGRLPYERMDVAVLNSTPEMIHNIPQPEFESILSSALAKSALSETRKNVSFISCTQGKERVNTVVEDRATKTEYTISSKYVIACDGAKSNVRDFLGIDCEGEDSYETMMTIHFHADLRAVVGENVGILHWIMDPEVSGFIIAYDLSGNQVLICNFDPGKHPASDWNEELCLRTLKAAVGPDTHIEVLSWRPWILSRKVARQYRSGNVFLAGDAAHSFPPTGGLGLNSGLADVHNLAYKIATALEEPATHAMLDSYENERRHVAQVNSQQSVRNGKKIFSLLKAVGTTTGDVASDRENLHRSLHDKKRRERIDEEVKDQQEHFDNLELHIGYIYGSSEFPPNASHYVSSQKFIAGARLPHAWVGINSPALQSRLNSTMILSTLSYVPELSPAQIANYRYSTLDLCAFDSFTLISSNDASATTRAEEIQRLLMRDEVLGPHQRGTGSPLLSVHSLTIEQDFRVLESENGNEWLGHTRLLAGGGVLVRPDQHVLLMLDGGTTAEEVLLAMRGHLLFA